MLVSDEQSRMEEEGANQVRNWEYYKREGRRNNNMERRDFGSGTRLTKQLVNMKQNRQTTLQG